MVDKKFVCKVTLNYKLVFNSVLNPAAPLKDKRHRRKQRLVKNFISNKDFVF